jgi:hypothetical protein
VRLLLAAVIVAAAAAQLWLAHRYFGFLTGDEVEVLAEAFRCARGFPFAPWNIRNLVVPDLVVAPAVWAASRLGVADPRRLIEAAALPFIAFSALTTWCVWRLALRWSGGDRIAALTAATLAAFHWIPLGFGSTPYPRNLAMLCVVAAALVVERWPFAAGALCGFAAADRFSEIVFLVPLLLLAVIPSLRRRRALTEGGQTAGEALASTEGVSSLRSMAMILLGAALAVALTIGLYDQLTWGAPFASAIRFARLTVVEPDFASRVKVQPPWWYLANLPRWLSPLLLVPLWLARRHRGWWLVIVPLAAYSIVRHKELRYLEAVIPFVMILAAIGLARMPRRWAAAIVAISLAWNLAGLRYFARKSMPAVEAAEALGRDPAVGNVALSQLWAFGDRLYLGGRMAVRDVGSPPRDLARALSGCDAAALWETDLDDPSVIATLHANGFVPWRTYRDGAARAVVVFRKGP